MYWGFGLLPGMPKKWKVCPIPSSAGNAQNTALDMALDMAETADFGVAGI